MTSMGFWDENEVSRSGSAATGASRLTSRAPAPAVKDDWEDDDDEEEEVPTEERNKQIWEDANTKPHHAMPEVVISRNTTVSTPSAILPPQGVFDQLPKMKILKRPTQSSSPTPTTPTDAANAQGSLKEREARYNAARERIFGSESPASGSSANSGTATPKSPVGAGQQVKVAREPRGPSKDSSNPGFGARGGGGRGNGRRSAPKTPVTEDTQQ